jgi:hypothetical protein
VDRLTGRAAALAALLLAAGPGALRAQTDDGAERIARQMAPQVERAVGLPFKRAPRVAVRSREQVRAYLDRKMAVEMPASEVAATQRAYRAFRLIPDTLDLRRLMLDLYAEQVAGFYEPDSGALFVLRGADPAMLRVIMAHELVHALQDQYTRIAPILKMRRHNDRQMAGQAVLEGQAMVASFDALRPTGQPFDFSAVRDVVRQQQASMPVFAAAPRIIQESLLFPYIEGGTFVQGFDERKSRPEEQPWNERLPVTTEQILHASRYTAHERGLALRLVTAPADTLVYEDDFGEFEVRGALETWGVADDEATAAATGWNGDRYVVLGTSTGTALVWVTAWDTPEDAARFERSLRAGWARAVRGGEAGRRWTVETRTIGGVKAVRLMDAPTTWSGWSRQPQIRVADR